ncbi:MAG: ATP-binding protein, partial [Myxococcota bacterium]
MDRIHTSRSLADQALSNLVNQFARPLDFLRELVQNSLDAGTPRVEVRIELHTEANAAERPVVAIHVDDFGEGMDEAIIDDQLTRLFSSNKEDDLTKIGKFGIGFTSIFAIRPEAVLVHTGRHGEFWELLFHADRTFEKVRVNKPGSGTRITLFKTMDAKGVPAFVEEARFVLSYWCEHSQTPILFEDRTHGTAAASVDPTSDPFAAFAEPSAASQLTPVNAPFSLPDALLFAESRRAETEVLVGLGASPRYGFYNGGLTLVNSTNRDVLGAFEGRLAHLCIKVRSDQLEHTLTRDNVLRDAEWERVMQQVVEVATTLRHTLLDAVEHACRAGEDLGVWHTHLALEVAQIKGRSHPFFKALMNRDLFRGHDGPVSLVQIERHERKLGRLLLHPGDGPLATALHATQTLLVRGQAPTQRLLDALPPPMR